MISMTGLNSLGSYWVAQGWLWTTVQDSPGVEELVFPGATESEVCSLQTHFPHWNDLNLKLTFVTSCKISWAV